MWKNRIKTFAIKGFSDISLLHGKRRNSHNFQVRIRGDVEAADRVSYPTACRDETADLRQQTRTVHLSRKSNTGKPVRYSRRGNSKAKRRRNHLHAQDQRPVNKKQPLRTELPAHLPRREEVIEPEVVPEGAKMIGEAVTEVLEYEPATLYVRRIVRPKYIIELHR